MMWDIEEDHLQILFRFSLAVSGAGLALSVAVGAWLFAVVHLIGVGFFGYVLVRWPYMYSDEDTDE